MNVTARQKAPEWGFFVLIIPKLFFLSADINKRAEGPLILSVPAGQGARRHSALFFYAQVIKILSLPESSSIQLSKKGHDNKIASTFKFPRRLFIALKNHFRLFHLRFGVEKLLGLMVVLSVFASLSTRIASEIFRRLRS